MFHPTLGSISLNISSIGHPWVGAMSPQGNIFSCGYLCSSHKTHFSQQITVSKLSRQFQSTSFISPQPTPLKEWDPIIFHEVPWDIPLSSQNPSCVQLENISTRESKSSQLCLSFSMETIPSTLSHNWPHGFLSNNYITIMEYWISYKDSHWYDWEIPRILDNNQNLWNMYACSQLNTWLSKKPM